MFSEYDDLAPAETSRVLVLLPPGRNRDLLSEWLANSGRYAVTTDPDEFDPSAVDLCLVSDASVDRYVDLVRTCKRRQHPAFVPCLLIDRTGTADRSVPEDAVDEVITSPLRKAELARRLASLLNARSLSLTLADSKRQYERLVQLLPAGVVLLRDDSVLYANRAAGELLGKADLEGEPLGPYVVAADRDRVQAAVDDAPATPARDPITVGVHGAGGDVLTVELSTVTVPFRGEPAVQVLLRDVTQREERTERLRLYRRAMDEAKVGITITDPSLPDNPVVYVNDEFLDLTGYAESAVLGRNCRFLQCDATDEETVATVRRAIDEERPVSVELLNERADGTRFMNQLDVSPVFDDSGDLVNFLGFQRDVTERHRHHSEIADARNRLQSTLRRISDAFISIDTDWRFTYVNDRAEELLESDADELVGECIWDRFPDAVETKFYDEYHRAMETQESVHFEEYYEPFGRWFEVTAYPAPDGITAYFKDVTGRKERERELERYETIVSTAGDPIFTLDDAERFSSVNAAMVEFVGHERERLLGAPLSLVCPDSDARAYADLTDSLTVDDTEAESIELTVESADGISHRCKVSVARLPGDGDETVGVLHDLTELHRREQHLAVLDRVLRHNLRNKMNVVLGWAEALEADAADPDAVSSHAADIADTARDLLAVSETARAFQNAVAEGVEPHPRDVATPIRAALEECERSHGDVECIDDLPASLWVQAHESVDMAFAELLENAAEHGTAAGGDFVRVTATREREDDEEWVTVSVADGGPGIPDGEGVALTRETETALEHGTGLGLWVVRWTVERSGGEVWVRENEPQGTVVKIRLRAADPPADAP